MLAKLNILTNQLAKKEGQALYLIGYFNGLDKLLDVSELKQVYPGAMYPFQASLLIMFVKCLIILPIKPLLFLVPEKWVN